MDIQHNRNCSDKIILASASPRRRYLLKQAGLQFSVIPADFEESAVELSPPSEYVKALAEGKASAVAKDHPESWIIGADTIVLVKDAILGKPESKAAARDMLKKLSGRTHLVLTGWAVCCKARNYMFLDAVETLVTFKTLSPEEIEWYIGTGEPFDKAGAYAIQGLGTFIVKRVEGSYTNVVGLPVCEVIEHLIQLGVVSFSESGGINE